MAMTPFALSLLGVESTNRRRQTEAVGDETRTEPDVAQQVQESRPVRLSRRATSYYNSFQTTCSTSTDAPPSYAIAARQRPACRRQPVRCNEVLPGYTCTVASEGKILLQYESINPLQGFGESDWKEVYMVLRGPLLSFHRLKDGGAGKLIRSYTLQHAEIGLASDTQHIVLLPQTRLAHLIPSYARRKAWQKDPDLFRPERQHILRLRAETDQILLADASEERMYALVYDIGAGIDISHAIDERSIPRHCTVPRRRRRRPTQSGDMSDPALLVEQERILREMYPSFAERTNESTPDLERKATGTTEDASNGLGQSPIREEDDLDLAVIREDFANLSTPPPTQDGEPRNRPIVSRQVTTESIASAYSVDMIYATSSANFNEAGKWEPSHIRTPQQIQRYTRRCMPVLLAESPRASDVLISNGKRVRVNWRMQLIEEWELSPPSYKSHGFDKILGLGRTRSSSQNSAHVSRHGHAQASVLCGETEDQIMPVNEGLSNLELSKTQSLVPTDKSTSEESAPSKKAETQELRISWSLFM